MMSELRNLARSDVDKKIAGICGGFGKYTSIPSWLWRAVFLMGIFAGGFGVIAYVCLWICMPVEGKQNK
ncbi:MAG: PspC domain-containing protein [Phycisphaeraceae bacterium]|nr:PspC domain-containing protein [Phycisphaeraceae bacterium]